MCVSIYMYIYVCVVYMCVCVYICMFVCMCLYIYVYVYLCARARASVCIYICIYASIYLHVYIYIYKLGIKWYSSFVGSLEGYKHDYCFPISCFCIIIIKLASCSFLFFLFPPAKCHVFIGYLTFAIGRFKWSVLAN